MINDNGDQEHFNYSISHWALGHLFTRLLAKIHYFLNSILFSLTMSEKAQILDLNIPGRLSVLGMLATVTRHEQGKRESASKGPRDKF